MPERPDGERLWGRWMALMGLDGKYEQMVGPSGTTATQALALLVAEERRAEREACAKLADYDSPDHPAYGAVTPSQLVTSRNIAAAIRARTASPLLPSGEKTQEERT